MRSSSLRPAWVLLLAAGIAGVAQAAGDTASVVTTSEGYLLAHPDLRWRNAGELAYQKQRFDEAFRKFRSAARYADKPAQAMLAAMLWNGDGMPADRAQAYAWMDLAAERGYPDFIATRERYWQQMDETERQRAVDLGQAIYAEFGDAVAKRRLEQAVARYRIDSTTGSHLGAGGTSQVKLFDHDTGRVSSLSGLSYHDARYWDADKHWQAQDAQWLPTPQGRVEVGPVTPVDATPADVPVK